jgi:hypothetical protein
MGSARPNDGSIRVKCPCGQCVKGNLANVERLASIGLMCGCGRELVERSDDGSGRARFAFVEVK